VIGEFQIPALAEFQEKTKGISSVQLRDVLHSLVARIHLPNHFSLIAIITCFMPGDTLFIGPSGACLQFSNSITCKESISHDSNHVEGPEAKRYPERLIRNLFYPFWKRIDPSYRPVGVV
jgi:hypothetical protein